MSRRLAVTIGLIVFVGAPRSAKADEIWALAQLAVGYGAGSYSFEGTANPGFGMDGQTLQFETPIRGFAVDLSGVLGWAFVPEALALGVGADLSVLPVTNAPIAESSIDGAYLASLSLLAAWLPEHPELSVRGGIGVATAGFAASGNDIGSADNIVEPERVNGPIVSVGMAWSRSGVGLGARLAHARLSNEHSEFQLTTITVGVLFENP